ncbi:hypothetical protein AVEN_84294-1 [Araneus ventricosus]|uniref:Uncharacterized protein n=1 Tax=Araneus ventricosus TaxID=182803 RepID=A0A4Y2JKB5_ARAVE|nr:hypothetical protein AVEN_84294-1 [Araneus ventricosus]
MWSRWPSGQTFSLWCGAKIPTLARPTQKGCKAGRGPAGRAPPECGGPEARREECQFRCRSHHLTTVQNYEVRPKIALVLIQNGHECN